MRRQRLAIGEMLRTTGNCNGPARAGHGDPRRVARLVGLVAMAALPALACSDKRDTADPAVEKPAIEKVLHDQAAAWNRGDIDGFMAGYANSPDLVFASGGKITKGWEPARDGYVKRYGGGNMGHLEFDLQEVTLLSADAAVVVGRFEVTETPQAGTGAFTLVLQRTADGWRVTHDHTSALKSAPASPPSGA